MLTSLSVFNSKFREDGPILLLLGGGMAAGKSTVREIIGSDQFWSNVSIQGWYQSSCLQAIHDNLIAAES